MKTLILYDSVFGNTSKIAQGILQGFDPYNNSTAKMVLEVDPLKATEYDLVIVGSPTRGFKPTPTMKEFIQAIPKNGLRNTRVAAFDTRLSLEHCTSSFVRFIIKKGGYASKSIMSMLVSKGGKQIAAPEGFLVSGEEGPLLNGEMLRASSWANKLSQQSTGAQF